MYETLSSSNGKVFILLRRPAQFIMYLMDSCDTFVG